MTTEPREEMLSAYLDGELSADERAQVERWLAEDAEYRQLYEELRAVQNDVQALPRYTLDKDLAAAVLRRAERSVLGGDGKPRVDGKPRIAGDIMPRSALSEWWSRGRSRRMFIWPVIAVAAALMVALFDIRQDEPRNVAFDAERDGAPHDSARRDNAPLASTDAPADAQAGEAAKLSDQRDRSLFDTDGEANSDRSRPSAALLPKAGAIPPLKDEGAASRLEEPFAKPPADARGGAMRALGRSAGVPAAEAVPGQAQSTVADQVDSKNINALKLETNIRAALKNREQVTFIQCDVSDDFFADKQMEKVLAGNKVEYRRMDVAPQADDTLSLQAQTQLKSKLQQQGEVQFNFDATPEQVEQIVTELQREQGRRRVSNIMLGLQEVDPSENLAASQAASQAAAPAPAEAKSVKKEKEAAGQADRYYYFDKAGKRQQSLTIYLRQMGGPQAAQSGKAASSAPQPARAEPATPEPASPAPAAPKPAKP